MFAEAARSRLATVIALVALAAGGCASGPTAGPPAATGTPAPAPSATSSPSPGSSAVPTSSPGASPSRAPSPTPTAAPGRPDDLALSFRSLVRDLDQPIGVLSAADGSGRLFVVEQRGRVRIVRDGGLQSGAFLDISSAVSCCGERGLLGLAFHPAFPADPRVFVDYTDADGDTVIASFEVRAADPDRVDPATRRVLLRVDQPFGNHNGGQLAFGPEGFLWIALGDGGSAGDPLGNGQRVDTLLGKILRINVNAEDGNRPYAIPADNPFAAGGGAGEVALWGLRNPWRFSFDRLTGDLWIGDVGQGRYEEVDVARQGSLGLNFGWARMEGAHCYPSGNGCGRPEIQLPIAEYGHDQGCSVTGGFVYRGEAQPAMRGLYVFADYCSGTFFAIDPVGDDLRTPVVVGTISGGPAAFGEDEAGELYVVDRGGGRLLRIIASPKG